MIQLHPKVRAFTDGLVIENSAMSQIISLANDPHVLDMAVMPDVHAGKGSTVGTVFTSRALLPSAVGVDIGCGMVVRRYPYKFDMTPEALYTRIRDLIPCGVGQNRTKPHANWRFVEEAWESLGFDPRKWVDQDPALQLGTLGSGNHFIEVCEDNQGWSNVSLHSGSRRLGLSIASKYAPDQWLEPHTPEFKEYVIAHNAACAYAHYNRLAMLEDISQIFGKHLETVHCQHNFLEALSDDTFVTRKGAQKLVPYGYGILPGSMGRETYIIRGDATEKSLLSAPHGAGRVLSRGQAKKSITMDEHRQALSHLHCDASASTLDESPSAYKDLTEVLRACTENNLCHVVSTLTPIVNVKGQ